MGNPLFGRFGGSGQMPGPLGNMQNFVKQFRNFQNQFKGDPRDQVQQLLNSGQMTQEQFNQLSNMANQLKDFMK